MFKTLNNVMFERIKRVEQVLDLASSASRKCTIDDSKQLQHDYMTLRGALEQDLFKGWTARTPERRESARGWSRAGTRCCGRTIAAGGDLPRLARAPSIRQRSSISVRATSGCRSSSRGWSRRSRSSPRTQGPDRTPGATAGCTTRDFPHPFVRPVRSADRRAQRRQRRGRRRRRQLSRDHGRRGLGSLGRRPTSRASRASPKARSTATCCRSGIAESTSRSSTRADGSIARPPTS